MKRLFFTRDARTTPQLRAWLLLVCVLLPVAVVAQTPYHPTTADAPRDSYQALTPVVLGVSDKTLAWTTEGDTVVGRNFCVVNEPYTIGPYTTNAGTYPLTAISNSDTPVAATSAIMIIGSSTPTTGHQRLPVTVAMLSFLQAKDGLRQHLPPSAANAGNRGFRFKSSFVTCRRSEQFPGEWHKDSEYRPKTQITLQERGNRSDHDAEENHENHTV